jgi:predicted Zn-dependent protease
MMRFTKPLLFAVAGWALVSCADIASPSRGNAYEWRRLLSSGSGVDTFSFHWTAADLPVKYWAQDSLNLPLHVQHGIEQWEAVFLYGEFKGVVVADSNSADVIVTTGIAPKGGFLVTRLESGMAPECQGATDIELTGTGERIVRPIRVYVDARFAPDAPGLDECMALTTTHEIGHTLGIFAHSPNIDDIMYADPAVSTPSTRDRSTAELAYHTQPTLTIDDR